VTHFLTVVKELTIYIAIKAIVLYFLWNYILVWQLGLPELTFASVIAISTIISVLFYSRQHTLTLDHLAILSDVQIARYKRECVRDGMDEVLRDFENELNNENNINNESE
jgi:hypothetical protein